MFNKIINCYNFFKDKKTPINQIKNLVIFLNILIIEMYEYYTSIKTDEPCLSVLRDFYNVVICELIELINQEAEEKKDNENTLNINQELNNIDKNSINNVDENLKIDTNQEETNKEERCSGILDNINISEIQNENNINTRDRATTYNNLSNFQNSNIISLYIYKIRILYFSFNLGQVFILKINKYVANSSPQKPCLLLLIIN